MIFERFTNPTRRHSRCARTASRTASSTRDAGAWTSGPELDREGRLPTEALEALRADGYYKPAGNGASRVLVMRQPGGDVAILIDELYGQRSFDDDARAEVEASGRYAHFIDRAYALEDRVWSVFSLERLSRTPEFRNVAT